MRSTTCAQRRRASTRCSTRRYQDGPRRLQDQLAPSAGRQSRPSSYTARCATALSQKRSLRTGAIDCSASSPQPSGIVTCGTNDATTASDPASGGSAGSSPSAPSDSTSPASTSAYQNHARSHCAPRMPYCATPGSRWDRHGSHAHNDLSQEATSQCHHPTARLTTSETHSQSPSYCAMTQRTNAPEPSGCSSEQTQGNCIKQAGLHQGSTN